MKNLSFKLILGLITLMLFSNKGSATCTTTITAVRDTFCLANGDTLTATMTGGVGYAWSGGSLPGTSIANPLIVSATSSGAATYTVTATDGTGCTATASYTLQAYDVSATSPQVSQPSCGRNNGSIQMSIQSSPRYVCEFFQAGILIQSGPSVNIGSLLPGTYVFTLEDLATGCSATYPNIVLTDTTTYPTFDNVQVTAATCFGDNNGAINVTVGNCTSGCMYAWSQNAGDNTDSATGLQAGTYTLSVSKGGCSNIDTAIIVPGPTAKLSDSLYVFPDHCQRHDGVGEVTTHGGTPPYSYVWIMGPLPGVTLPSTIDTVKNVPGDTTLYVITTDSHGCTDTMHGQITTKAGPSAEIVGADSICATEHNGVLIVQATSNDGPFTYRWSSGSTTPVAGGLSVGPYSVTVENAVGCDTVLGAVVRPYNATISMGATPLNIYQGQTVDILVQTGVPVTNVHWTPYVDGSTGMLEAFDKPMTSTRYTVIVDYGQSCELFDTAYVFVSTDTSKMIVPNTFTPNNDGINDNFMLISYQTTLKTFHIWVYDRWGNKVYESVDPNFAWDGSDIFAGNRPLNTGVFAYAIEYTLYNDPEKRILGGNISLVK